jgi:hypothetical protein
LFRTGWGAISTQSIDEAYARCQAQFPADCSDYAHVLQQNADASVRAEAWSLHQQVCEQNAASQSCLAAAQYYLDADDLRRAIPFALTACRAGREDACLFLAEHAPWLAPEDLAREPVTPPSGDELRRMGLQNSEAACRAGDGAACRDRDSVLIQSHATSEVLLGLSRLLVACDQDDGTSCLLAGMRLLDPAPSQARTLLDRACSLGRTDGCEYRDRLDGNMPEEPDQIDWNAQNDAAVQAAQQQRYADAVAACSRGDAEACESAAYSQLQGLGTNRAPQDAIESLNVLCESGRASSCGLLAFAAEADCGTDVACEALPLHERACAAGHRDSCEAAERLRDAMGGAYDP